MQHYNLIRSRVDRETFVLDACKGKNVLHLGCADAPYTSERLANGTWFHGKLSSVARRCVGLDRAADSVEELTEMGLGPIIVGDAEQLDKLNLEQFDVIVAGEILEHLNNPGLFLEGARRLLPPSGRLIITTTNAFAFRRFIRIPFGEESIHPDHTFYFSHITLRTLVERFNYKLVGAHSYAIPNKKPLLPYLVERIATSLTPNWGEGIVHSYCVNLGTYGH